MKTAMLQTAAAFAGSAGFAILFHLRNRRVVPAAAGGALCWAIYLLLEKLTGSYFTACLIASAFAAVYAETLARIEKSPSTVFYISAAIPLIPGHALYHTMDSIVAQDFAQAWAYGLKTILYMVAISTGASIINAGIVMHKRLKEGHLRQREGE